MAAVVGAVKRGRSGAAVERARVPGGSGVGGRVGVVDGRRRRRRRREWSEQAGSRRKGTGAPAETGCAAFRRQQGRAGGRKRRPAKRIRRAPSRLRTAARAQTTTASLGTATARAAAVDSTALAAASCDGEFQLLPPSPVLWSHRLRVSLRRRRRRGCVWTAVWPVGR